MNNEYKSCLLWLFGAVCWVTGYLYPNENGIQFPLTNIWRGLLIIIVNSIILRLKYPTQSINIISQPLCFWMFLRFLCVIILSTIFPQIQFYLPLPIVHTLNCLAPIIILVLDYYYNGIAINRSQFYGVILAFLSVIVIIWNTQQPQQSKFIYQELTNQQTIIACILMLFCVLTFSYIILITKKLKSLNPSIIALYHGFFFVIISGCILSVNPKWIEINESKSIDIIVYIKGFIFSGLIFSLGNLAELYALKLWNKSGLVTMTEFTTIIIAHLISIFRYGQNINWIIFISTGFMIFGIYQTISKNSKQQSSQQLLK